MNRIPHLAMTDFASPAHREIFAAINDAHLTYPSAEGHRFTALVAAIAVAVDPIYLHRLPEMCPQPAHLSAYARMVTEAALIRDLGAHADRIERDAADLIRHADRLRLAGAATGRSRAFPDHLAKLAQAMQQHVARLDPDRPDGAAGQVHVDAAGWPSDPQARREAQVLADLIQHPGECEQVMEWLPGHAFARGPRREVYEAMRAVVRAGNPIDPLTVAWQLGAQRASDGITGFGKAPGTEPDPAGASPDYVFQLASLPVDPGSAIFGGGLRLADHIRSELSGASQPDTNGPGRPGLLGKGHQQRLPGPTTMGPSAHPLMQPPPGLNAAPGLDSRDHEPRLK